MPPECPRCGGYHPHRGRCTTRLLYPVLRDVAVSATRVRRIKQHVPESRPAGRPTFASYSGRALRERLAERA